MGKGFTGREIRFLLLQAHYRETYNFTLQGLQSARASLMRIDECLTKLREVAGAAKAPTVDNDVLGRFTAVLDDDLNISGAWGVIFDWVRDTNRKLAEHAMDAASAAAALGTWDKFDSVLGVGAPAELEVPAEINALLEARQAARKAKDFKRADAVRDELKSKGWIIEDTPKGPKVKRL